MTNKQQISWTTNINITFKLLCHNISYKKKMTYVIVCMIAYYKLQKEYFVAVKAELGPSQEDTLT